MVCVIASHHVLVLVSQSLQRSFHIHNSSFMFVHQVAENNNKEVTLSASVEKNNMKEPNIHLEVLQKEPAALVKPESETPKGLYFLSNLDQNIAVIVRTIYCFKSEERGNEEAVQVIKKALSQVLVHYYPLAGRLTISPEGTLLKTINDQFRSL